MLAAGTVAQATVSAVTLGLPVLAPALRAEYGLSLAQIGVVFSSVWVGTTVTLLPWGLLADRVGERAVLAAGLCGCALALVGAAFAPGYALLVGALVAAGGAGASVSSASGRAVMHWFGPHERGLALGLRQTAIPVGGVVAALGLPAVERAGGVEAAFLALAGLSLVGALAGAVILRERVPDGLEPEAIEWTLRDGRLWRLSFGSGLYLVAQVAVLGFVVLYLHDERGLSPSRAAAVLAAVNVLAAGLRIGAGRWSDVAGWRVVPLRRIGLAIVVSLALAAALLEAPLPLLVPAFVLAGALSMAWNGLSFTAAAELAGRARSGAAIGFQQTALSVIGIAAPVAFAATVTASSWYLAFALAAAVPLAGWWALGPLAERPR